MSVVIKVDNKKTIRHVADTSFKADKMRNLFAVIAVVLTTILFCGLFTIASSLLSSMEESVMRQVGGSGHGGFKYLTEEQYENLKKHPSIKEISYSVVLGMAENPQLAKRPSEIRYANDELVAKINFSLPTTGRLPENEKELATDTLVLERLGVPARIGEKVTLQYSVCGKKYEETFTLCGFWEGDIIRSASEIWLSRDYIEGILQQHDLSRAEKYIGTWNADVNFSNSWNLEKKLIKVIEDSGYRKDEIDYGVNWAYAGGGSSMDAGTAVGAALILAMIIFCGYLMISNVFLISVTKDIHFYGLLKTIGTTGKQIRLLIRRQAWLISLIGIPAGLILGSAIGGILTPIVLGILNTNVIKVSFSVWVYVFSIVFALLTVFISIRKAAKMAAKVSPIEALRTTEVSGNINRKRKGKIYHYHNGKIALWKMAAVNVGRNRKKAVWVTISLSLSMIILNASYTIANGFDMDKYLSRMIGHDFVIGDVSWFNVYMNYSDQTTLSEDLLKDLAARDGVQLLERIYFTEGRWQLDEHWNENFIERIETELGLQGEMLQALKKDIHAKTGIQHIYGVDDTVWKEFILWEGELDLEKLKSGQYVVVNPFDSEGRVSVYKPGDRIEVIGKDGKSRSCEVLGIGTIPYNLSIQHSHATEAVVYMSSEVFLETVAEKCPMTAALDVEPSHVEEMENFLQEYSRIQDPNLQYASKATYAAEYENTQKTYKIVGSVISALLALIGIANFANTSITSIMTRKRELAMLQSIGMTGKQQKHMLVLEGMTYMLFTAVFTWTIGILLGQYGVLLMFGGNDYFTFDFTILPSAACMPLLFLFSILIPVFSLRYVQKESIVDRLRQTE